MLIPEGPEVGSHFLRRSNLALVVYHLRKTINCLLTAGPFAAASFAWLMPTQLHCPHHGIAEHRREACAPIPRPLGAPASIRMPYVRHGHLSDLLILTTNVGRIQGWPRLGD